MISARQVRRALVGPAGGQWARHAQCGFGMTAGAPALENDVVKLEPASAENVDLLIEWTLDPVAQGPYKQVPSLNSGELRELFLHSPDRRYFLIRRATETHPLGRFYWRAWFGDPTGIDRESEYFLGGSRRSGQRLRHRRPATRIRLSDDLTPNTKRLCLHRRSKPGRAAGSDEGGISRSWPLPSSRYPVSLPNDPCVLFVRSRDAATP